jgi:hypothetical protein
VESLRPYKIREVTGGENHSVACTDDGKLLVWGRCDEGQAGIKLENLAEQDLLFDGRGKPRILLKPTVVPGIHAVSVAAAVDNSIAVTAEGKAYSWGFSANHRTGLGTEETVEEATLLDRGDVANKKNYLCGVWWTIFYTGWSGSGLAASVITWKPFLQHDLHLALRFSKTFTLLGRVEDPSWEKGGIIRSRFSFRISLQQSNIDTAPPGNTSSFNLPHVSNRDTYISASQLPLGLSYKIEQHSASLVLEL